MASLSNFFVSAMNIAAPMKAVGQPPMAEYTPGWSKSATKMGTFCNVGMPWNTG